jgi:hypothetical protein
MKFEAACRLLSSPVEPLLSSHVAVLLGAFQGPGEIIEPITRESRAVEAQIQFSITAAGANPALGAGTFPARYATHQPPIVAPEELKSFPHVRVAELVGGFVQPVLVALRIQPLSQATGEPTELHILMPSSTSAAVDSAARHQGLGFHRISLNAV